MKNPIIILLLLFLSVGMKSQRMFPNQKGLELGLGMFPDTEQDTDYFINIGLTVQARKGNYSLYALEYSRRSFKYQDILLPVETFSGEFGYSFNILSNRPKSIFINTALSAIGAYEVVNKDIRELPDGAYILDESGFIYGAGIRLSVEYYVCDWMVLMLYGKTKLLLNSILKPLQPSLGVGLRINL